jgi:AcrR family transcriptional regulator
MAGDSSATRTRLLGAALTEFAQYGLAGARVDRIAENAGSNKAQIYHYFGSKRELFEAVFANVVATSTEGAELDPERLPEYATELAARTEAHPEVMRFVAWRELERPADDDPAPSAVDALRRKIDAVAVAQEAGVLSNRFPADVLVGFVLMLGEIGTRVNAEFATASGVRRDLADVQKHIAEAVRLLVEAPN